MSEPKPPFTVEELKAFIEEVNEEAKNSERASILIAAGMLDEMLKRVLIWFMVEDKIARKLVQTNGPLGTFSARIDACFALGLISKSQLKGMHQIRDIRNAFAHKLRDQIDRESVFAQTADLVRALAKQGRVKQEQVDDLSDERVKWHIIACATIYLEDMLWLFLNANRRSEKA